MILARSTLTTNTDKWGLPIKIKTHIKTDLSDTGVMSQQSFFRFRITTFTTSNQYSADVVIKAKTGFLNSDNSLALSKQQKNVLEIKAFYNYQEIHLYVRSMEQYSFISIELIEGDKNKIIAYDNFERNRDLPSEGDFAVKNDMVGEILKIYVGNQPYYAIHGDLYCNQNDNKIYWCKNGVWYDAMGTPRTSLQEEE